MTNFIKCEHYFSVTASAILRIDNPYKIAITSHSIEMKEALVVTVGVYGVNKEKFRVENYKEVQVESNQTTVIKLELPNLQPGHYYLHAKGMNYSKTVSLYFNSYKISLFVQLDALVYQTTDIIKFRVIAIDSRTRPAKKSKNNKISILDFSNNELKSWMNVTFELGIFEGVFEFNNLNPGTYEVLTEFDETVSTKILLYFFLNS